MFKALRAWIERWLAFRELRSLDPPRGSFSQSYFDEEVGRAREALSAGNREQAVTIWQQTLECSPEQALGAKGALELLLDLCSLDQVDAIMQEGRRRRPRYAHFAVGCAEVARRRGNLSEALDLCAIVRKEFPGIAEGYSIATICLTALGRHQEAEAMIERAVRTLPDNFDVLGEHARHAMRRGDWPEAMARWSKMRERFSSAAVVLNIVQCLRALDRNDEAEEILADLSIKMPGNRYVLVESATIASARGDFEEASRRWAVVRKRIPLLAAGYTSGVEVERRLGREAEADQILVQAVTYLKSDLGIHLEYARSAQRRGDWTSALERWALVRERFSECDEAREQEAVAVAVVDTQAGPGDLRPSSA